MCGIFGVVVTPETRLPPRWLWWATGAMFKLSESRGKEAAGLAVQAGAEATIHVYKAPETASRMIRRPDYKRFLSFSLNGGPGPTTLIGHSRLVTNGLQVINQNNQPVIRDGLVGVHNGIITNEARLWESFPQLERRYDVDTEVLLALIRYYLPEQNSLAQAVRAAFARLQGATSVAVMAADYEGLCLATNNGSLYTSINPDRGVAVFASERYILQRFLDQRPARSVLAQASVSHLAAGEGLVVLPGDLTVDRFSLQAGADQAPPSPARSPGLSIADDSARYDMARGSMRRCTRCILPETMPFIQFDDQGVCNYCRDFQGVTLRPRDELERIVAPLRGRGSEPDCIIMFSGGRDSSYGLHYLKTELGLNPIAYTYDWGMITDLGRRNQSRLCGRLGVEHILVSADIPWKRKNVRKNVEAWLKKPDLGMVPLFMAGDKQYYYYANRLKRQTGLPLIFVCECPLELSRFKAGFCGVNEYQGRIFNIPFLTKLKLGTYYLRQYLTNPAYLNRTLFDNLFAFWSSYFLTHDYVFLYNYVPWQEDVINETLIGTYDWETDPETPTTWRIGDGTAAFYNYIYHTVAGLTENDTLRSNQVRLGVLTRDEALRLVERENRPRWKAMEWYSQTIGFDFNEAIRTINAMPKLYGERD